MSVPIVGTAPVWACSIEDALDYARAFCSARGVYRVLKHAFLNRACELACVPLAQYYAESPSGLDLVWITYRPEAVPHSPRSIDNALVYLDSVDNMTEDQARARALEW